MRYFFVGLFCVFIFNNVYARTVDELVSKIANSTPVMQYAFWFTKDDNKGTFAYVALKKNDGSFRVWNFTKDKTWQPIHNAGKIGIFPKVDNVFSNIALNQAEETISFKDIISNPSDEDTNKKAKLLENKKFDIGWYFWIDTKIAFLFSENKNKFRIWHFTAEKKWQPIHNAGEYDGFPVAEKTLENISFNPNTWVLTIGKSILSEDDSTDDTPNDSSKENKPSFPKGITLKSSDITAGEFLDVAYATSVSPSLSWDVSDDIKNKNIIKSYAISLKDLDVDMYHWNVINIPSSTTSFPKGASFNYQNSRNIPNDFGTPSYLGPFPPAGETHDYEFSVYGFVTSSIGGTPNYKNAIYKSSIKVKYTGK